MLGHVDAVGKVTLVREEAGGARRAWIRPPRRFLYDIVAKGFFALEGVSVTVAETVRDRFSVALIPITLRETTLGNLRAGDRVNLEADLFVKSARELHAAARLVAGRAMTALPWAGALRGPAGVQKAAAELAAGGAVVRALRAHAQRGRPVHEAVLAVLRAPSAAVARGRGCRRPDLVQPRPRQRIGQRDRARRRTTGRCRPRPSPGSGRGIPERLIRRIGEHAAVTEAQAWRGKLDG